MRYLFAVIALAVALFALAGCDSSCTTATEKTYTPTASVFKATDTPSCPKADDRFDVDTAAIIAKFAGGSATYAPAEGEVAKPDYIPDTITVGQYTKCFIHTETVDPNTKCMGNNYFKLYFAFSSEEITEINYSYEFAVGSLVATIKTPLTDGTICSFSAYGDVVDGGECKATCYNPTKHSGEQPHYSFVWHAPQ
jgi:hypothetical protein